MKEALENIFKIREMIKDMVVSDNVVNIRDIFDLLNTTIEDMTNYPSYYLQYRDDGPQGISCQSMDFTCDWNKIVLLDNKLNEEDTEKLLKAISVGRKNPRFENSWLDSGFYPGNNVIDMRMKIEEKEDEKEG